MNQPTRPEVQTVTETAECQRCGVSFDREAVLIDGKPFGGPRRCPACVSAREKDIDAGERTWDRGRTLRHLEGREGKAKAMLDALKVPKLYQGCDFESSWQLHGDQAAQTRQLRMRSAGLRYLSEWPDVHHWLLVLRGSFGTGKGHWLWTVAQHVARHGGSARVLTLADLVREIRATWTAGATESDEQVVRRFRTLDFLGIDEVSRHAFHGDNLHQHLYDVLNDRVNNLRPTVLTSNESQEDLAAILRPALWSRIHGAGGILEFGDGPDFRKRPRPTPPAEEVA